MLKYIDAIGKKKPLYVIFNSRVQEIQEYKSLTWLDVGEAVK